MGQAYFKIGPLAAAGGPAVVLTGFALMDWVARDSAFRAFWFPIFRAGFPYALAGIGVPGALVILLLGIGYLARRREELLGLAANLVTLFVIAPLRCVLDSILALSLRPIRERWLLLVLPLSAGALVIALT